MAIVVSLVLGLLLFPYIGREMENELMAQEQKAYMEEIVSYRVDFEDHALLALNDNLDVWTRVDGNSHGGGWFFLIVGRC